MQADTNAPSNSTTWTMSKGQAQTIRPQTAGLLRATSGRVWATRGTSATSPQLRWCPDMEPGDIFLRPGATLRVEAGQTVVIESWPSHGNTHSRLEWEAMEPSARSSHWHHAVVQPAGEMVQGWVLLARAFGRLVKGLAGYSEYLVAGRGKVQTCLDSNAP